MQVGACKHLHIDCLAYLWYGRAGFTAFSLLSRSPVTVTARGCVFDLMGLHLHSFTPCRKRQATITTELIEIIAGASALVDSD